MANESSVVRTTIYLHSDYHDFLREYAHNNRISMSQIVRNLLDLLAEDEDVISTD